MSLFQQSVLKHYLKSLDNEKINRAWQKFSAHFLNPTIQENIRNSKEEQYQEGFLRDLFVNILGYTLNPENNFNLTTELKNVKDSKKADGAIIIDSKVTSVIELKGTNTTDLSKIEEQAFGYKNNQENDCIYVITSNFEKIRFYIENAIDHIEFNLFQLDENQFKTLYICLSYESISRNLPKKLKDESLSKENDITKKLYKDYSQFKRELFQNLSELNPEFDPLELFKKSQKLIDRFLFLFFAEDRFLLPPNSVRNILTKWDKLNDLDAYVPLIDRFRQFFCYLNTGKDDIFAYNGGLFKPDEVLDFVKIDDNLLYTHTQKLADYNFQSEVDVNILGHIFENSLNEIDEIKAQLEGTATDKSKTKRKKDGVFYTPRYITKYIVENTVGKLCEEKKIELQILDENYTTENRIQKKTKEALLQKLKDYRTWLLELTIVDPACGSGAFLNEALNFLIEQHRYLDELEAKLFGDALVLTDIENSILENNLFGVDINEESVEIAKLSLWLRTAQPNRKLNDLSNNIKCGNSLIDDPEVAGDKAFNWQLEFPHIFEKGGFDVVIGNPPYVNIVNIGSELERGFYQKMYQTVKNKSDLYSIFTEKSYSILKEKGMLGFIFPNSWLGTDSFSNFREFLVDKTSINQLVKLPNNVFSDAVVTPLIILFRKEITHTNFIRLFELQGLNFEELDYSLTYERIKKSKTHTFSFKPEIKIINETEPLGNYVKFSLGIKTSDDKRFISEFTVDNDSYPILRGRNIKKYFHESPNEYIWYKPELITQKAGGRPRVLKHFLNEKILIQDIAKEIIACYCDEKILVNDTINMIYEVNRLSYKTILCLLNCNLINKWFENEFQEGLHIKINQLETIPISNLIKDFTSFFDSKADQMLTLNKQLQEISQKFQRSLQREFEIETLGKKLENWYELSYADFLKELKKKKVELNLSQKDEWEDYFTKYQQTALTIQTQITQTDKAIDQMVYQLYGLTPEEIEIVETN